MYLHNQPPILGFTSLVEDQPINKTTPEPGPFNIETFFIGIREDISMLNNKFEKSRNENIDKLRNDICKENREKLDKLDQRLQKINNIFFC